MKFQRLSDYKHRQQLKHPRRYAPIRSEHPGGINWNGVAESFGNTGRFPSEQEGGIVGIRIGDIVNQIAREIAEKDSELYAYEIRDQIVRSIDFDKRTIDGEPLPVHSSVNLDKVKLLEKLKDVLPANVGRRTLEDLKAEMRRLENEAKGAIEAYNAQAPELSKLIVEEIKRAENPTLVEFSVK